MEPIFKWIAGATGAIVLIIGAASIAGASMDDDTVTQDIADVIPAKNTGPTAAPMEVDPAAIGEADVGDDGARATIQPAVASDNGSPTLRQAAEKKPDERFVVKRILPIKGPIKYGEWHWDEEGVPPGPIVMTVDLDARVLSIFRGGYEIGATAVLLGTQDHPTPTGTFPILQKKRHNISSIYNVPMPYTMRLTWDGISIHSSDSIENGFASHGCIATPDAFAAKLFAAAKKGDKVIITRGETMGVGDAIL
ncbi:hypothetical protein HME9302_00391 [Alteripontixanthobacter maritimus]|uniref:L,D-TPase catalytic domain-containing protein n=1 Tax=Alteripontixanthobacter maritimus TaxID=2161824 RepID=A0A369Q7Q5_9SPHN|nr:L,D-transpeptidase family protein [Alteripontixanthobacter maritimus]RDC59206.1 hypothetical protein HME9302_00391 [Alteripontixanthobacter maritimus]